MSTIRDVTSWGGSDWLLQIAWSGVAWLVNSLSRDQEPTIMIGLIDPWTICNRRQYQRFHFGITTTYPFPLELFGIALTGWSRGELDNSRNLSEVMCNIVGVSGRVWLLWSGYGGYVAFITQTTCFNGIIILQLRYAGGCSVQLQLTHLSCCKVQTWCSEIPYRDIVGMFSGVF